MICICKQRGSSTNSPLPSSSLTDPQCPSPPAGVLREVAVSQLAGSDIHSNPFSCGSLHKFCTNRTNSISPPPKKKKNSPKTLDMSNWKYGGRLLWTRSHGWGHGRRTIRSHGGCCPGALMFIKAGDAGGLYHCNPLSVWRATQVKLGSRGGIKAAEQ